MSARVRYTVTVTIEYPLEEEYTINDYTDRSTICALERRIIRALGVIEGGTIDAECMTWEEVTT